MKEVSNMIIDTRSLLIKKDLQKIEGDTMRQENTKLYGNYEAPDYFKTFDWRNICRWAGLIAFVAICLALIGYDISVNTSMNGL